ncbi:alpha/beta hydrolase family protein [Catellatospora paridis]|uniref:alpha/beta hydrolase family protein n=1 Tax=Catellatospora paridis TaxID=1617086 RepID=UPI0012D46755|nr:alpha/beta fold hydrolase [Catellatospora paridis]
MRTITTATRGLVVAILIAVVTGCGAGTPSTAPLDPSEAARQRVIDTADLDCLDDTSPLVAITDAEQDMTAAIQVGTGDTAVVLLHQLDGTACQWYPFALILAQRGYRALAPDITSRDAVDVAQAGIAHLRAGGAKRVFVIGASRGGTVALAASAATTPPVDGVIALSAPTVYDADALTAVTKLEAPTILIAGDLDGTFAEHARELYGLSVAKHKKLLIRSSVSHGVTLLSGDIEDTVMAFLTDPATTADAPDPA